MSYKKWVAIASLLSLNAMGAVNYHQKVDRVKFLEQISKGVSQVNLEAFHRELFYEQQGYSLPERADMEANLLAEKVRNQVVKAYETSLKLHGDEDKAAEEIRSAIEKDLELVSPDLQDELRRISFEALDEVQRGRISATTKLDKIKQSMLKHVQSRFDYLNAEQKIDVNFASDNDSTRYNKVSPDVFASVFGSDDASKAVYKDKKELMAALVSDQDAMDEIYDRYASTSMDSVELVTTDSNISLQVKVEFLGIGVEAGPTISFSREFRTMVNVVAQSLNPVLLPDGNFDFYMRDRQGKIIKEKGKERKRKVGFMCRAQLEFASRYTGSGGFTYAGMGGGASVSKSFRNSVNLESRRLAIPEYVGNKTATYKYLNELCHNDFLNAQISNTLTIKKSLNIMMKNVISSLRFSHPKTKCAVDSHCFNWYNKELIPLVRVKNYPRCVAETREKFMQCELRGLQGQNCAVYDNKGTRISDGQWEYKCDTGLKCVKYQDAGWFSPAKGKCMPTSKSYRSPLQQSRTKYIEVNFVD